MHSVLCLDCPRSLVFLPCSHFAVCAACATDTCTFSDRF